MTMKLKGLAGVLDATRPKFKRAVEAILKTDPMRGLQSVLPEGGAVLFQEGPHGFVDLTEATVFASAEVAQYAAEKLNKAEGHHVDQSGKFMPLLETRQDSDYETAAELVTMQWSDYTGDAPYEVVPCSDLARFIGNRVAVEVSQVGDCMRGFQEAIEGGQVEVIETAAECFAFLSAHQATGPIAAEKAKATTGLTKQSRFNDGFQLSEGTTYVKRQTIAARRSM